MRELHYVALLNRRYSRRWLLGGGTMLIGLLGSTACQGSLPSPTTPAGQAEAVYNTAESLGDLVSKSDLVVLGTVRSLGAMVNGCRDPMEPAKPDPRYFCPSQVYQISVERYLKGTGNGILEVAQGEGEAIKELPVTKERIEQARAKLKHIPMGVGRRYVFFLRRFQLDTTFYPAKEPWRFSVASDGLARAESPWDGAAGRFPARPVGQLVSEVERLVARQPPAATPTIAPPPPKPGQPSTPPGK